VAPLVGAHLSRRRGSIAAIFFGVAALAWFVVELSPQFYGFEDTDSPAVMLAFLRGHGSLFALGAVALFVMAGSLTVVCFAASDVLRRSDRQVGGRTMTFFGLIAAASFFLLGVVRFSTGPVLHIDGLKRDWGEAAFLVTQMMGTHGFAQAAVMALCIWAVGVTVIAYRTHALPAVALLLAVFPAVRFGTLLLGPFAELPDELWIIAILAIPGTLISAFALGLALVRADRSKVVTRHPAPPAS
jgi:hypothetical protein